MLKKIGICLFLCLSVLSVVLAAPKAEDFSCQGLYLGDTYEKMTEQFGKPRYQQQKLVQGIMVTYYVYKDDLQIGLDDREKKVVDIQIKNKDYAIRDGIKIGATPYKIQQVYGKNEKKFIAGKAYYIYSRAEKPGERLVLEVEATEGYLQSFRLTSLPLTDDEADRDLEIPMNNSSNDVNDLYMKSKDIDTSAVTGNS